MSEQPNHYAVEPDTLEQLSQRPYQPRQFAQAFNATAAPANATAKANATAAAPAKKTDDDLDGTAWKTGDFYHYNEHEYRNDTPKDYEHASEYSGKAMTPEQV